MSSRKAVVHLRILASVMLVSSIWSVRLARATPEMASLVDSFEFVEPGIRVTVDLEEVRHMLRAQMARLARGRLPPGVRLYVESLEFGKTQRANRATFSLQMSASKRSRKHGRLSADGHLELEVTKAQKLRITVTLGAIRFDVKGISFKLQKRGVRVSQTHGDLPTFGIDDIRFEAIRFIAIGLEEAVADLIVAP